MGRRHLKVLPGTGERDLLTRTHFGGGSPGSRALTLAMRATVRPFLSTWSMTSRLPWPYGLADQAGRLLRKPLGTRLELVDLPECRAHVISNAHVDKGRVVIYFQGGAFLVGGFHLHQQLIARIARLTGATVVVPRFRKLPQHPVTASIEDGLAAYEYALDRGVAPADIAFAGDSAGGFLSFMVALAARDRGLPMPGGIVAMSPLIDLDPDLREMRPGGCALFSPRAFRTLTTMIERAHARTFTAEPGSATRSPTTCDLSGLPPVLVQVSSAECLHSDASRVAAVLAEAGVECELQVWDHQVHVFQAAAGLIPEADQALDEIVRFADRVVPGSYARVQHAQRVV